MNDLENRISELARELFNTAMKKKILELLSDGLPIEENELIELALNSTSAIIGDLVKRLIDAAENK